MIMVENKEMKFLNYLLMINDYTSQNKNINYNIIKETSYRKLFLNRNLR